MQKVTVNGEQRVAHEGMVIPKTININGAWQRPRAGAHF